METIMGWPAVGNASSFSLKLLISLGMSVTAEESLTISPFAVIFLFCFTGLLKAEEGDASSVPCVAKWPSWYVLLAEAAAACLWAEASVPAPSWKVRRPLLWKSLWACGILHGLFSFPACHRHFPGVVRGTGVRILSSLCFGSRVVDPVEPETVYSATISSDCRPCPIRLCFKGIRCRGTFYRNFVYTAFPGGNNETFFL